MRIDAGLIIGIALEFVIMLYFANSTLQPKKNYYMSSAICFIGYLIIFGVSIFNMFIFNIISFTIIDFLIFILGYRINYKTALFQTFMMTLFMFLGELLMLFILKLGLDTEKLVDGEITYIDSAPSTMAAHLDGKDFTEEQWSRIKSFADFIKLEDNK